MRQPEGWALSTTHRSGGCQCGAVRYTLNVPDITVYACHCRECQKQSASAFALSVPASLRDLTVDGKPAAYERPTDSGSRTRCWVCPKCGTRLYHQSARSPDRVTLKGGTLDDPSELEPVAHLWVSRKQAWLTLPPGVPAYETQPEDLAAWRHSLQSAIAP